MNTHHFNSFKSRRVFAWFFQSTHTHTHAKHNGENALQNVLTGFTRTVRPFVRPFDSHFRLLSAVHVRAIRGFVLAHARTRPGSVAQRDETGPYGERPQWRMLRMIIIAFRQACSALASEPKPKDGPGTRSSARLHTNRTMSGWTASPTSAGLFILRNKSSFRGNEFLISR